MGDNVILIGMPGAGKSTVGVVLAKVLGYDFVDSDLLIQNKYGMRLSDMITAYGLEEFKRIEEDVNAGISVSRTVVATGGSVVYGDNAMKHLRDIGVVVYIKLPYDELEVRLGSLKERGVVLDDGQTLMDLYEHRCILYEKYAHITINGSGLSIQDTVNLIKDRLSENNTLQMC